MDKMNIFDSLKNDQEFLAKLAKAETNSQICEMFAGKGISITEEEIRSIRENGVADELNEDALDNVSGGYLGIAAGVAVILFLCGLAKGAKCR